MKFLSIDMDPVGDPYVMDGITYFVGRKTADLEPGMSFVLPTLMFYGEKYLNGVPIEADPLEAWPLSSITSGSVWLTIDKKVVLDSRRECLDDFSAEPCFFKDTIYYGTAPHDQARNPVWLTPTTFAVDEDGQATSGYATGAVWVEGIGFMHQPLSVGTHTLHLVAAFNDPRFPFGYDNTWTITVSPKKGPPHYTHNHYGHAVSRKR